jgi:hypothetical protein
MSNVEFAEFSGLFNLTKAIIEKGRVMLAGVEPCPDKVPNCVEQYQCEKECPRALLTHRTFA